MDWFKAKMLVNLFLVITAISALHSVNGLDSRKLDETPVPGGDQKCGPCTQYSPPPPPSPPPPSPPPPPKKPPSPPSSTTPYCPPPPASLLYITGPPGELYPVDPDFNSAPGKTTNSIMTGLTVLIGCGLFGVLALW